MPTACLNQPNLKVALVSERLEIYSRGEEGGEEKLLKEIPLYDLERVVAHESVYFTSPALAELLKRQIPILLFAWNGKYLGGFMPAQNRFGYGRIRQYRASLDSDFLVKIARKIVKAKIYNQRRIIQRLLASRAGGGVEKDDDGCVNAAKPDADKIKKPNWKEFVSRAIDRLGAILIELNNCNSIDEIRGYEGAATAKYFQAWSLFLPDEFPFEQRSTRPPLNPVNACISFAATIIYGESAAFINAHGLDPAIGVLHSTDDDRLSLALDLIEPFRPAIVEAITLDLFSHQILNHKHFENREGGVYLNNEGRQKFFFQYERRMERQFMSESVGHRTTLRQQLENQAIMLKSALDDPEKFEPFLVN